MILLALALLQDPVRVHVRGPVDEWREQLKGRAVVIEENPDRADVVVLHGAGDRGGLDAFLKRGGGLVALHDAIRSGDPGLLGGAWDPAESKTHRGTVGLYFTDRSHPIASGAANVFLEDEISWDLRMAPDVRVVAHGFRTAFEVTPQVWTLERDGRRAFVSLQKSGLRPILLRGIAWAAKRDPDLLLRAEERAALAYPEGGPVRPELAAKRLEPAPGFRVELVAAEPDVVKPIALAWDARGRLWVAETPGYPDKAETWKRPPHDRIVILEEKRRKVFFGQLDLVTGLLPYRDGVLVTQSPDILFLRDTDGDDVADRREVLFTGFGYGDTHAVLSNLRWGFDGWVYADQGYSGGASKHVRNAAGRDFGKIGQGVLRFRPDGSAIEAVAGISDSNTWGIDLTWDGEIFVSLATNGWHLQHVVMHQRHLERGRIGATEAYRSVTDHRHAAPLLRPSLHPYIQIDNVGGFSAAAASCIYEGGAWPAEFAGSHFMCEPAINLVHEDLLRPEGATFRAARRNEKEFLAGTDLWFRPVDLQVGPDGAMYVADFYNQAVIHNDIRGPKHGPHNAALRPDRDHEHGRVWRIQHRDAKSFGAVTLDKAPAADLVKALEHPNRWWRLTAQRLLLERGGGDPAPTLRQSRSAPARVLALWLLHLRGQLAPDDLAAALRDPEPGVRKNAARVAGERGVAPPLLDDADLRVRVEAILAGGAPAAALVAAWKAAPDDVVRTAVFSAASRAALEAAVAGDAPALAEALGAVLGGEAIAIATKPGPAAEAALRGIRKTLPRDFKPAMTKELREGLRAMLRSGSVAAFPLAARWIGDDPEVEAAAAKLFAALEGGDSEAGAALLEAPKFRARAIGAAVRVLDARLIDALGDTADDAVPGAILGAWPRLTAPLRERALGRLLRRSDWARRVIAELAARRLDLNEIGPPGIFLLRSHPDRGVAEEAGRVIDAVRGESAKSKEEILARLRPVVERGGDAEKGRKLFAENCLKCHAWRGEGKAVGPDLTGMGVHARAELLVHIVDPNRMVEPPHMAFNVRTRGGAVLSGLLVRETPGSVVLRNAEGEVELRRAEIEALVSTGRSLMPEGFEALGGEGLRDLLAHFCSEGGRFRVLDLQKAATVSTKESLYNPLKEEARLKFARYGLHEVEGVPYEIPDPARTLNGLNAIVLKGGLDPGAACKSKMPRRVEIEVGAACARVYFLGCVGPWASSHPKKGEAVVKVTFVHAGGVAEERTLRDGVEIADWIRRADVPGSVFVDGLLAPDSWGQVRRLALPVANAALPLERIVLESADGRTAPTFFALTAELSEGAREVRLLHVGGGDSHDYERWWKGADLETFGALPGLRATYTSDPAAILPALEKLDVLSLGNNQQLRDEALRKGIFAHVERGGGLLLLHPATWYNWKDWPEYNRVLVGGGARGHEHYGEFEVRVADASHPLASGVPATFKITDELYHFVPDTAGSAIHVVAVGRSLKSGKEFPVVWTVSRPKGRTAAITLGHDGAAHAHASFQALLRNAARWVSSSP